MTQRLQSYYFNQILPDFLHQETKYSNPFQVPKLQKIVLNRGLGDGSKNLHILESSLQEFLAIESKQYVLDKFSDRC